MADSVLPKDFAALEPFIGWALATETARSQRRRDVAFEEIQKFYDAMLPQMMGILDYLNRFPLDAMPAAENRLLELSLAFAEIAPFAEQYRRTILPELFDERRFVPMHDLSVPKAP